MSKEITKRDICDCAIAISSVKKNIEEAKSKIINYDIPLALARKLIQFAIYNLENSKVMCDINLDKTEKLLKKAKESESRVEIFDNLLAANAKLNDELDVCE
ncbi:MAG: hypothetical protein ACTSUF_03450 [Candidatus Heimdallarchaeaceae archaeon]